MVGQMERGRSKWASEVGSWGNETVWDRKVTSKLELETGSSFSIVGSKPVRKLCLVVTPTRNDPRSISVTPTDQTPPFLSV